MQLSAAIKTMWLLVASLGGYSTCQQWWSTPHNIVFGGDSSTRGPFIPCAKASLTKGDGWVKSFGAQGCGITECFLGMLPFCCSNDFTLQFLSFQYHCKFHSI
ncbi:hypothetical protein COO60DRAFT_309224 [Scenedesmus sp. NREL 46B-D3]|nr:hypothetical protein COO60DRAFT_309224 [Scenedesmus sp. NREL 46B-D3]